MRPLTLIVSAVLGLSLSTGCALFESKEVAEGKQLYQYYCAQCHGPKGYGNGFNAEFVDPRPRDLTDSLEPYLGEMSNDEVFKVIKEGVSGYYPVQGSAGPSMPKLSEDDEGGSPLMPYWGYTLTDAQLWSIVAYLRTLHKSDAPKIEAAHDTEESHGASPARPQAPTYPDPQSAEATALTIKGEDLYWNRYSCAGCHRIGEKGGQVGPDLSRAGFRLNPEWVYQWIQYPQAMIHETKMPAFNMPEEDAKAIALYLKTVNATAEESPGPPNRQRPAR